MEEPQASPAWKIEDGLLSERVFPIDMGRWVLERKWDLTNPRCPVVLSPYHNMGLNPDPKVWVEQRVLTAMEYRRLYGTNGHTCQGA